MNSAMLTQATLLALTMQNQAQKVSPNGTARLQGTVINRNIYPGDTVCGYYNEVGNELLKVAEMPSLSGNYFVDDKNLLYSRSGDKLVVKQGITGEIVDDTIDAYDFIVKRSDGFCAYKTDNENNNWTLIFFDGSRQTIELPFTQSPIIGYRNGIVAAAPYKTYGFRTYVYRNGELVNTLANITGGSTSFPYPTVLIPISESRVAVIVTSTYGLYTQERITYQMIVTPEAVVASTFIGNLWYNPSPNLDNYWTYLGRSESHMYFRARNHDPENNRLYLDEWIIAEIQIEEYQVDWWTSYEYPFGSYGECTTYGNLIVSWTESEVETRSVFNLPSHVVVYANEDINPISSARNLTENGGWIWIQGCGVYQKKPRGWVIYPTSVYPKSEPYGRLGYAVRAAKVGSIGDAIVLFEEGT